MGTTNRFNRYDDQSLDYYINWNHWVTDESIISSEWILPDGLTSESENLVDNYAGIFVSGGVSGQTYELKNKTQTDASPNARGTTRSIFLIMV